VLEPGFLNRMQIAVLSKALDRGDLLAGGQAKRRYARPGGDAVNMHSASAALGNSAAVLGARHADPFAQHPQ